MCDCLDEKPIYITGSYWFIVDQQKVNRWEESLLMHPVLNLHCRNLNRLKEQLTTLEKCGIRINEFICSFSWSVRASHQLFNTEAFSKQRWLVFLYQIKKKEAFYQTQSNPNVSCDGLTSRSMFTLDWSEVKLPWNVFINIKKVRHVQHIVTLYM